MQVKPQDYGGKHMFSAPLYCYSHPLSPISKCSFHPRLVIIIIFVLLLIKSNFWQYVFSLREYILLYVWLLKHITAVITLIH